MVTVERSWTDAITNSALLGGFDALGYLAWLAGRSARIESALPQFLHEFTHHWCFDSIVGNAIAQLVLRARRNALVFGVSERFDEIESDVLRAQAAELMLQPLAEGLALFAEFDITPGESRVESRTTTACLSCFGFPIKSDSDPVGKATMVLRALLQTTRRQPAILERKAGVYAQSFECEAGYLAGYLSVKAMWAQLASKAARLHDRDLYLAFLRSYVYDDARLALLMVDRELTDSEACEAITDHIYQRIGALVESDDLVERVTAWESACEQRLPVIEAIGVTLAERERANDELMLLMDDVQHGGPISEFAAHAMMTLQERRYLTLGAISAVATTQDNRTSIEAVAATPEGRAKFLVDQGHWPFAPDTPLAGELVAVTPSRRPCVLVYFVADKQARLIHSLGPLDDIDQDELARHVINRRSNAALHEQLEVALAAALADPLLSVIVAQSRRHVLRVAEELYGKLATLHAEDEAVDGALARLRRGGLLALLDDDADLVRGVASIGLANTVGSDPASLAIVSSLAGLDDALIERTIATASIRHGMRLLARGQSGGVIAVA
jgi:hypothetical protein